MSAAAHNPDLSGTLHRCTYETKQPVHETIINRATARGEIPAGTDPDLLHEVLYAMVLSKRIWAAGSLDNQFAVHVVDDVLLPVLRRGGAPDG
jgi:hypothetical protein